MFKRIAYVVDAVVAAGVRILALLVVALAVVAVVGQASPAFAGWTSALKTQVIAVITNPTSTCINVGGGNAEICVTADTVTKQVTSLEIKQADGTHVATLKTTRDSTGGDGLEIENEAASSSLDFDVGGSCVNFYDGTTLFGGFCGGASDRLFLDDGFRMRVGTTGSLKQREQSGVTTPATGGSIAAGACLSRGSLDLGSAMEGDASCSVGITAWTGGINKSCEPIAFVNNTATDQADIYMCNRGTVAVDCDGSNAPTYRATCTEWD